MTRLTMALLVSMPLCSALAPAARAQVADFEPVTTEELLAPGDGDWINWRRTLNGQGFRRQKEGITIENKGGYRQGRVSFPSVCPPFRHGTQHTVQAFHGPLGRLR